MGAQGQLGSKGTKNQVEFCRIPGPIPGHDPYSKDNPHCPGWFY